MKELKIKNTTRIVTFILIIFGLVSIFNYLKEADYNLATLDGHFGTGNLQFSQVYEMHKDDFITGTFKSQHPNLGIIAVRFNTFNRINDDTLAFRLKEVGASDWYYQAEYKVDQFQNGKLFPFGFPLIKDSKNKTYQFEIYSLAGSKDNAVVLNGKFPTFVSKHVFSKDELLENKSLIFYTTFHKIIGLIRGEGVLLNIFVYFMPALYFTMFIAFSFSIMIPTIIVIISIIIDLVFSKTTDNFFAIAIIFAWLLPVIKFNINNQVSALVGLGFLSLVPLLSVLKIDFYAEKSAIWAFLFLAVASGQQVFEMFKKSKPQLSVKAFWDQLKVEWYESSKFIYHVAKGDIVITSQAATVEFDQSKKPINPIIYKINSPTKKINLTISRPIANTIIYIVKVLRFAYRHGPYLTTIWLLVLVARNYCAYKGFYNDFFIANQTEIFWSETGKYLFYIYLATVAIFIVMQRNKNLRQKAIIATAMLLVVFQVVKLTTAHTTDYRDDVVVWAIKPTSATLWDEIEVTGRNFKELPFKGKAYVDGVEHAIISWSDRHVVFQADPTKTKTGEVKIVDYYGNESGTIHLDYYDFYTKELIQ